MDIYHQHRNAIESAGVFFSPCRFEKAMKTNSKKMPSVDFVFLAQQTQNTVATSAIASLSFICIRLFVLVMAGTVADSAATVLFVVPIL